MRQLSHTLFGFALTTALLLQACGVAAEWIGVAALSVLTTFLLTQWMPVRSIGLAGLGGLSLLYTHFQGANFTAAFLTALTAALLLAAVILAISADCTTPKKEESRS